MAIRRTLLVAKILKEKTNFNNKLTIKDLIDELKKNDYIVTRNTVKEDINSLRDSGYEIIEDKLRHNTSCYYLKNAFSIEESRVILDGVSTNKFIKNEMKNRIRSKILDNISIEDRIKLKNVVRIETIDTGEIDVSENLFLLHESISTKVYICFNKANRDIDKKIEISLEEVDDFIPKGIYYFNDRYYLIGFNKDKEIRNYRVDRIANIRLKNKHNNNEKIDFKDYGIKNFDMFGAKKIENVELKVNKVLINSVIEKFGEKVNIHRCFENEEYFILNIEVGINKGLVRWILKQGSDIEVISPIELIEEIKLEVKKIIKLYED